MVINDTAPARKKYMLRITCSKRGMGIPTQKPLCEDLGLCGRWDEPEFGQRLGSHVGESKGSAGSRGRDRVQNGGRGVPEAVWEQDWTWWTTWAGTRAGPKRSRDTREKVVARGVPHQAKGFDCHHMKWDSCGYLQSLVHHSCTRMGRMEFWKDDCWLEGGDWISNF